MNDLEEQMVKSCSPTLAGIKSGCLFRYRSPAGAKHEIDMWNRRLREKGIELRKMRRDGEYALIYIFRRNIVCNDLKAPGVSEFLIHAGYDVSDIDSCIDLLARRMNDEDFPHEVGLFLGYPLHDVLGFMNNCGRDCRFCGCWKVYDDEHQTKKQFIQFKECKRTFIERYNSGTGVTELAV